MDGVQVLKSAFGGAHMWYLGTTADVTAEQVNSAPRGLGHPIGEHMAHILQCEDFMCNTLIQGKPTLWEEERWSDQVGGELVVDLPVPGSAECAHYAPVGLAAYAMAVFANTDSFLDGLTENDLECELNLVDLGFPNNMSMGAFLTTLLLGNTYAHTGEISALKGMLGSRGYPF